MPKKPKNRSCLRCGAEKTNGEGCSAWGEHYNRHLYQMIKKKQGEKKTMKAYGIVNMYGVVLDNEGKERLAVYSDKVHARKHGNPFSWEKVIEVAITYQLPKTKKAKS